MADVVQITEDTYALDRPHIDGQTIFELRAGVVMRLLRDDDPSFLKVACRGQAVFVPRTSARRVTADEASGIVVNDDGPLDGLRCPSCRAAVDQADSLCRACGAELSPATRAGRPLAAPALATTCGRCGAASNLSSAFCSQCGAPLPQIRHCFTCGAAIEPADAFCKACGANLGDVYGSRGGGPLLASFWQRFGAALLDASSSSH